MRKHGPFLERPGRASPQGGRAAGGAVDNPPMPSPEEVRELVHEFEVHRAELDMQNDQLRREMERRAEAERDLRAAKSATG